MSHDIVHTLTDRVVGDVDRATRICTQRRDSPQSRLLERLTDRDLDTDEAIHLRSLRAFLPQRGTSLADQIGRSCDAAGMTGAAPEAESTTEKPAVDVIGSDEPPSHRSRRLLLLLAVVGALALAVALAGSRHHAAPQAGVPDDALLTTGPTDRAATGKGGTNLIAFSVENLGQYPVTVQRPRIEAPGVSVVSTTGAGPLGARQSAMLTISFSVQCSEVHNAQRAVAAVLIPYVSGAGRQHQLRETAGSTTVGPGRALGQVINSVCS